MLQRTPNRSTAVFRPKAWSKFAKYLLLSIAAAITFFPFYAMVVIALKPNKVIKFPGTLSPTGLSTASFQKVLAGDGIWTWMFNTLIYSVVSVVLVLLLASIAGYAFAKGRFPGKEAMFWSFLAMVMVPYHVTLIPTFIMLAKFGGIDTYWGLIVPTLANTQAIFLMRQFIQGIPDELLEAARIDGASEWRILVSMVLPLCKPILATLGTFVFLWHWNDFLWPLIIGKSRSMWTLTVGIASLQQQQVPLSEVLAGSAIALTPIFLAYLLAQRYFQESITSTSVKG